jgi:lysophospholipase L1-like esterase
MMRIACFGDSLTSGLPGSSYFAVLRENFPDDTLLNFGKGNDTVVSLFRRVSAVRFDQTLNIAFLWIGVNDVPQTDGWSYRAFHNLVGQRRAKDIHEFRSCYQSTVELLCGKAERVIVAPPALKGENLDSRWNRRLGDLAKVIRNVAAGYDKVEFLDLQAAFARELASIPVSDQLPRKPFRVLLDALTLKTDEQVDAKAAERGLHLTLDGVHLNSAGAKLVASALTASIRNPASLLPG